MNISEEDEARIRSVMRDRAEARRKREEEERSVSGNLYFDSQAQELSGTGLNYKVIDGDVELEWATREEKDTKGFIVKRRPAKTSEFETIASYEQWGPLVSKGAEGGIYRYLDSTSEPGCFWEMVTPLVKRKIVKKRTKRFLRHQSDLFNRIDKKKYPTWRKPRGIDSRVRRREKGTAPHANIGYGSAKATRHLLPSGFLKFTVNNVKELELLLMHNRKYAAEIAHSVSIRKRKEIVERAAQLNINVTNAAAKTSTEEAE